VSSTAAFLACAISQRDFLYDGLTPVKELNGATVLANLLTGLGIDEVFRRTDAAGARNARTYQRNSRGS
jgi:hypothetical protein